MKIPQDSVHVVCKTSRSIASALAMHTFKDAWDCPDTQASGESSPFTVRQARIDFAARGAHTYVIRKAEY